MKWAWRRKKESRISGIIHNERASVRGERIIRKVTERKKKHNILLVVHSNKIVDLKFFCHEWLFRKSVFYRTLREQRHGLLPFSVYIRFDIGRKHSFPRPIVNTVRWLQISRRKVTSQLHNPWVCWWHLAWMKTLKSHSTNTNGFFRVAFMKWQDICMGSLLIPLKKKPFCIIIIIFFL